MKHLDASPPTENELRRLFPGITDDCLYSTLAFYQRIWATTGIQKSKASHEGKADNRPQKTTVDETSAGRYRVRIAIAVSDDRKRDGDGCESTILDCLVRTRRRLLSLPDRVLLALYDRYKGSGRGVDIH